MKNQQLVIVILVAVIVGAAGFFGGMQYQKSQTPATPQFTRRNANGGPNGANGSVVRGQILSVSDTTITVKLNDGSSKIVVLSANTAIDEATTAVKTALTVGKQVMVLGSANTDGSVTAQNIQLGTFGNFGRMGTGSSPAQ